MFTMLRGAIGVGGLEGNGRSLIIIGDLAVVLLPAAFAGDCPGLLGDLATLDLTTGLGDLATSLPRSAVGGGCWLIAVSGVRVVMLEVAAVEEPDVAATRFIRLLEMENVALPLKVEGTKGLNSFAMV